VDDFFLGKNRVFLQANGQKRSGLKISAASHILNSNNVPLIVLSHQHLPINTGSQNEKEDPDEHGIAADS